jgi:hypothetical protein
MRQMKLTAVLLMTFCLAEASLAQEVKPASGPSTKGPILKQIPAGTMGYLVVGSIKDSTSAVDKFLLDIGVGQLIKAEVPNGILDMLQKELDLGEGFDATGGFAVTMLDPGQFDIDLAALVERKMNGEMIEDVKLPFVIFVPGTDIMGKTFPNVPMSKDKELTILELPVGPMFAVEYNGYILISPNAQALQAVKDAKVKADSELSADRAALIARSSIAIQMNMKICAPAFTKILDLVEKQAGNKDSDGQMGVVFKTWQELGVLKMYKEMLNQIDSITIAGGIGKTGVMFEEMVDWNPASDMGKAFASVKVSDKPLLGRVPNMTYAIAIGSAGRPAQDQAFTKMQAMSIDMLTKMITQASEGKVTKEQADKALKLWQDFEKQSISCQMVLGGAPEGQGLFGLACVTECDDAAKAKDSLAQMSALGQEIINSMVTDEKDRPSITYTKAGEGDLDVIEITHPELLNMPEDSRKMMKAIMGEDKIRILIGSPDAKTVVVTFGGGQAFMAEALKTATAGGTLPQDAGLAAAMENMPKNLICVIALNPANLFDLILKGAQEFGVPPIPFRLTNQVPLTIGVGVTGSSEHVAVFVPTPLVKEVTGLILMQSMMSQPKGPKPTSAPSTADF